MKDDNSKNEEGKKQEEGNSNPQPQNDERVVNLEKKLGDLSDEISGYKEFISGASVVINTLAYTPELREAFQAQLKKQYGVVGDGEGTGKQPEESSQEKPPANNDKAPNDKLTKTVDDVASSQRESSIRDFEKDFGIAGLKEDEKKEVRRKVEGFLNEFGWSVKTLPLTNLRSNLEKAYMATQAEKLKEEGKLEGFAQARSSDSGMMGTFNSSAPQTEQNPNKLTSGQTEWAKKLGVNPEEAEKTYSKRDDEQIRIPPAEQKKA